MEKGSDKWHMLTDFLMIASHIRLYKLKIEDDVDMVMRQYNAISANHKIARSILKSKKDKERTLEKTKKLTRQKRKRAERRDKEDKERAFGRREKAALQNKTEKGRTLEKPNP